ncbi:MAG: lipooligosaccharide transport system ATP-binding protein [Flavobacteriales bacterium]|jgi:lipooligosaccharide transport system ATP-binding protein
MVEQAPAVIARGLQKSYADLNAVDGISFEIPRGVCFGFLGPNGAGKSTTMRMIYRATPVGGGALHVLGHDAASGKNDRAIKARIGVIHQENNLDEELSVRETLSVFCGFHGLHGDAAAKRVDELMAFASLTERADSNVRTLSGGMKRRLMVARGIVGDPELVVLDEPTTGLDPRARQTLWEKLADLKRKKATLILTTHYMDEAERLCDTIAVMDNGRIVAVGSPEALIETHAAPHVVEVDVASDVTLPDALLKHSVVRFADAFGGRQMLYTEHPDRLLPDVVAALPHVRVLSRRGTLDDVFLRLTGNTLDA